MLCTNCGLKLAAEKGHETQRKKYSDYKSEMRRRARLGGLKKYENLRKRAEELKEQGLLKTG